MRRVAVCLAEVVAMAIGRRMLLCVYGVCVCHDNRCCVTLILVE